MDEKEGIGDAGWSGEMAVQVGTVSPGSPAQAAGLQPGDTFVKVNDQPVSSTLAIADASLRYCGGAATRHAG